MPSDAENLATRLFGRILNPREAQMFGAVFGALLEAGAADDPDAPPYPSWMADLGVPQEQAGLGRMELLEVCEKRYRQLVRQHHPDRPGGSAEAMTRANAAISEARRVLG